MCQKSKVQDWINHFTQNYPYKTFDLTKPKFIDDFVSSNDKIVGVINYDVLWRRKQFLYMNDYTLILDESSLINNETANRSKFVLKMTPTNTILLSGTMCGGKYEKLWSQANLVGWNISKKLFYNQYIEIEYSKDGYPIITGYKNVERLKNKLRSNGCVFMKSEEVLDLPTQNFIPVNVPESKEYKKFKKSGIIITKDYELVGDTTLTKLLYSRMLCGHYNAEKIKAFKDLVESTDDRLIVFYNFNDELEVLKSVIEYKPISIINGQTKDLSAYEQHDNSVTFVQYQAGSAGLNLQKANKMIYFTPPLSCEHWMQSAKRIHRIGTTSTCFYYKLIVKNSVEERIYQTLDMRENFTNNLFEDFENGDL